MKMTLGLFLLFGMVTTGIGIEMSEAMSVDEAYAAIPHKRTVFDIQAAGMLPEEKEYLGQLFSLVDLAIVERVSSLQKYGGPSAYQGLLTRLDDLNVPPRLENVHQWVRGAIIDQNSAFEAWSQSGSGIADIFREPQVHTASQKLQQAYGELMRLYPEEGRHNKQAFFDYLCALDFF